MLLLVRRPSRGFLSSSSQHEQPETSRRVAVSRFPAVSVSRQFPFPGSYGFVALSCSASFTAEYALTMPPVTESDPNGTCSPFSAPGRTTF